jgi:hypothetical protein
MNHSDLPNTDFRDFYHGYALYDLQPGEEVTCDYRELFPNFQGFGPQGEELLQAVGVPGEIALAGAVPVAEPAADFVHKRSA